MSSRASRALSASETIGSCAALRTDSCLLFGSCLAASEDLVGTVSRSRGRAPGGGAAGGAGRFAWAICVSSAFAETAVDPEASLWGAPFVAAVFCELKAWRGGGCRSANHSAAEARPAAGTSQRQSAGRRQIIFHGFAAFRATGWRDADAAAARLPNLSTSLSVSFSPLAARTAMIFWQRSQSAKWLSQ